MLDIRWMRENRTALAEAMRKLNDADAPWEQALDLDEQRRSLLTRVETLRAERKNHTRALKRKSCAVSAPTGHTCSVISV